MKHYAAVGESLRLTIASVLEYLRAYAQEPNVPPVVRAIREQVVSGVGMLLHRELEKLSEQMTATLVEMEFLEQRVIELTAALEGKTSAGGGEA